MNCQKLENKQDLNEFKNLLHISSSDEGSSSVFHYRKIDSDKIKVFDESKVIPIMQSIMKNNQEYVSVKNNKQCIEKIWTVPNEDLR